MLLAPLCQALLVAHDAFAALFSVRLERQYTGAGTGGLCWVCPRDECNQKTDEHLRSVFEERFVVLSSTDVCIMCCPWATSIAVLVGRCLLEMSVYREYIVVETMRSSFFVI